MQRWLLVPLALVKLLQGASVDGLNPLTTSRRILEVPVLLMGFGHDDDRLQTSSNGFSRRIRAPAGPRTVLPPPAPQQCA